MVVLAVTNNSRINLVEVRFLYILYNNIILFCKQFRIVLIDKMLCSIFYQYIILNFVFTILKPENQNFLYRSIIVLTAFNSYKV